MIDVKKMNEEIKANPEQASIIIEKFYKADKENIKAERQAQAAKYNDNFDEAIDTIMKSIPAGLKTFVKIDKDARTLVIKPTKGNGTKRVPKSYTVDGNPVAYGKLAAMCEDEGYEVNGRSAKAVLEAKGHKVTSVYAA